MATTINLATLSGANGFRLDGVATNDFAGMSVSGAGDVNGDGFADLVVGASGADPNGLDSGSSYVVFGKASGFAASLNLSTLDGTDGFRLDGGAASDLAGVAVSVAGDVNGDGIRDLIVGANHAAGAAGQQGGQSFVVFGSASGFAPSLNLSTLSGSNGFRLTGAAGGDESGTSVSDAGDVNGDGYDDLIVGAPLADANGANSGAAYVVFGKETGFAANIDLSTLDGANGFRLAGAAADERAGISVSGAGDVNDDGFQDVIVGAVYADANGVDSGASYVVFGKASGFMASNNLSALNGADGFRLAGAAANDQAGFAVSTAGDVNNDGFADVLVSAVSAGPNGVNSGASYVVFGKASGFAASLNLSALNGANGFRVEGAAAADFAGTSVSGAGDVNGDGFADFIVGATGADPNGSGSGAAYVVFGTSAAFAASINLATLDGTNGVRFEGVAAGDTSGFSVSGAGDVNGDGFGDFIVGANGADPNGSSAGAAYVVFGGDFSGTVIAGTDDDDTLSGGSGSDTLNGLGGRDTFNEGPGNDTFDGGAGVDTALYSGNRLDYAISGAAGNFNVSGPEGDDTLISIERLEFLDHKRAYDLALGEPTGNTVRIIGAAFGTGAILPQYVGIGIDLFDFGRSMQEVCELVVQVMALPSDAAFVTTVYQNVVGVPPPPEDLAVFTGLLVGSGGPLTRAQLLAIAADTDINAAHINLIGLQTDGVEYL